MDKNINNIFTATLTIELPIQFGVMSDHKMSGEEGTEYFKNLSTKERENLIKCNFIKPYELSNNITDFDVERSLYDECFDDGEA